MCFSPKISTLAFVTSGTHFERIILPWATEGKGFKKLNYDQLDALLSIDGLHGSENAQSTDEAHQKFMKLYPKIFIKEMPVLPGIPENRRKGLHACKFDNVNKFGEDSHNISLYLNKINLPKKIHFGSSEYIEMMQDLAKILRKTPILRTDEEHENVFKTMKHIPDIAAQLSDVELRELSTCVIREFWVKGSAVDGSQGFYAILKGSAKPQTKFYKRLIGGNFVSVEISASNESRTSSLSSGQMSLGVGSCFGTLLPLPQKMRLDVITVITEENCDILKIPSRDYLRIKEERVKREKAAKEELIHRSPYYQNWPMVFIFKLTSQLKWKKFPKDYVFMKGGEINKYIGFIKSGCCNAYRIIPALVKRPLGKMVKRMRQVHVGQLHPQQSFGEVSVLLQTPSQYTLKAATPVELGIIDRTHIIGLDPVIQMLLLQTAMSPFENITCDDLKFEYIKKELEKEWKQKKENILKDVLFHNGICPGVGKWVHELSHSNMDEKKSQEGLHLKTSGKPA